MPPGPRGSFLEVAVFSPSSALAATRAGASRIELCTDYSAGGLTPPLSFLHQILSGIPHDDSKRLPPVHVMIRPPHAHAHPAIGGNDFVYTDEEFETMKRDLRLWKEEGRRVVKGFVFGILIPDGCSPGEWRIDVPRCTVLVNLAHPLSCTFHRAFDYLLLTEGENAGHRALEDLVRCGFSGLLTAGGIGRTGGGAVEGRGRIRKLVEMVRARAEGGGGGEGSRRLDVIVGGGVRASNVELLKRETGAEWFHSSAIVKERDGDETVANEAEIRRMVEVLAQGEGG